MSKLADLPQEIFHSCVNLCCAFTGAYSELESCPYCQQPCYDDFGAPCCLYCYTPLLPQIQSMYLNAVMAQQLSYQSNYKSIPGEINDVFDGTHYWRLLTERVRIDGQVQPHNFFSNPQDVAIGFLTDGFQIFKRPCKGS